MHTTPLTLVISALEAPKENKDLMVNERLREDSERPLPGPPGLSGSTGVSGKDGTSPVAYPTVTSSVSIQEMD